MSMLYTRGRRNLCRGKSGPIGDHTVMNGSIVDVALKTKLVDLLTAHQEIVERQRKLDIDVAEVQGLAGESFFSI